MSAPFTYVNRRGHAYYLQRKPSAGGKQQYTFSRKLTGEPVESLPEGYEAHESPERGQVTLRRIKPSPILPGEKLFLEKAVRARNPGLLFIVDVQEQSLVVYTSDMDADAYADFASHLLPAGSWPARRIAESMAADARYQPMLRFTLVDADQRRFNLERWCFRGSVDGWISLEAGQQLPALVNESVRHLGKESFFELM